MSEPVTEAGRAAAEAIKSGALALWADDPDDPIGAMVADVEAEAVAAERARLRAAVEALRPAPNLQGSPVNAYCNARAAVLALLDIP